MHLHAEQDKTPFSEKFIAIQWACQTGDICPWNELVTLWHSSLGT